MTIPWVPVPAGAELLYPPPAPAFDEDDFLAALQALLPRGRAWPRGDDSNLTALLRGLAAAWAAAHTRQGELLQDGFPASTLELLPEWEATLGLPDPCAGPAPIESQRRAQVIARFAYQGGQSIAYFTALAAALGGTITIAEYAPSRANIDSAMGPLRGDAWAHIWQVTLSGVTLFRAEAAISHAGDPLWSLAGGVIGCEIQRLRPGHTIVQFASAPGVPAGLALTDLPAQTDNPLAGAA